MMLSKMQSVFERSWNEKLQVIEVVINTIIWDFTMP